MRAIRRSDAVDGERPRLAVRTESGRLERTRRAGNYRAAGWAVSTSRTNQEAPIGLASSL